CRRRELADEIAATRENRVYLRDVRVPDNVLTTASLDEALDGARAVVMATISRGVYEVACSAAPFIAPDTPVVHATKGLDLATLRRLSEVIAAEIGQPAGHVAVLSGPTHAEEVGRRMPTAAVVACADPGVATV